MRGRGRGAQCPPSRKNSREGPKESARQLTAFSPAKAVATGLCQVLAIRTELLGGAPSQVHLPAIDAHLPGGFTNSAQRTKTGKNTRKPAYFPYFASVSGQATAEFRADKEKNLPMYGARVVPYAAFHFVTTPPGILCPGARLNWATIDGSRESIALESPSAPKPGAGLCDH